MQEKLTLEEQTILLRLAREAMERGVRGEGLPPLDLDSLSLSLREVGSSFITLTSGGLLRGCIGIGHSAATHHSGNHYPLYAHFPGLRVVVPSQPDDAKGLVKTALNALDPVLFLEHREILTVKGPVPEGEHFVEFGRARVLREGRDATVVALAFMVHKALAAAEQQLRQSLAGALVRIDECQHRRHYARRDSANWDCPQQQRSAISR